jgi:hypothetical protein
LLQPIDSGVAANQATLFQFSPEPANGILAAKPEILPRRLREQEFQVDYPRGRSISLVKDKKGRSLAGDLLDYVILALFHDGPA